MIHIGRTESNDASLRHIANLVGFADTDALFEYFARPESISADP